MKNEHSESRRRIERKKEELLSPPPLRNLDVIEREIELRPKYIGPGPWIEAAGAQEINKTARTPGKDQKQ